jgi:hypothetical protein
MPRHPWRSRSAELLVKLERLTFLRVGLGSFQPGDINEKHSFGVGHRAGNGFGRHRSDTGRNRYHQDPRPYAPASQSLPDQVGHNLAAPPEDREEGYRLQLIVFFEAADPVGASRPVFLCRKQFQEKCETVFRLELRKNK